MEIVIVVFDVLVLLDVGSISVLVLLDIGSMSVLVLLDVVSMSVIVVANVLSDVLDIPVAIIAVGDVVFDIPISEFESISIDAADEFCAHTPPAKKRRGVRDEKYILILERIDCVWRFQYKEICREEKV